MQGGIHQSFYCAGYSKLYQWIPAGEGLWFAGRADVLQVEGPKFHPWHLLRRDLTSRFSERTFRAWAPREPLPVQPCDAELTTWAGRLTCWAAIL